MFFTRKQDLVISPTNEITGKLSESHISPSSLFIQFYKTCYKTNPVLNEHISTTKLPASLRHSHKHLAKEKKKMEVSLAQKLCGGTIVEVSNVEKAKNVERFKIEKHEDAPSYKHTKSI